MFFGCSVSFLGLSGMVTPQKEIRYLTFNCLCKIGQFLCAVYARVVLIPFFTKSSFVCLFVLRRHI